MLLSDGFLKLAWRKLCWLSGTVLVRLAGTNYKKVVLNNFNGHGYSCNPKYIAEALERLYPGQFKLVLLANDDDEELPEYVTRVSPRSMRSLYELATARFFISNCRFARKVPKPDDQVYIQTWHASLGPKKVEMDAAETLSPGYVQCAKDDASYTDIMFTNNDLYESVFRSSFWYEGPIVRCGVPRNKPLIGSDESSMRAIKEQIGIPEGVRLCLYVPTFRDNLKMDAYAFDYSRCASELERRFGAPFVFAYRLHPVLSSEDRPSFMDGHLDLTSYPDIQELLGATDVLITDYSSCLEDFALTGRPGFVYAPDLEYVKEARGFNYPLESRPLPIACSEQELLDNIAEFDQESFDSSVSRFFKSVGYCDDGNGDVFIARLLHALSEKGTAIDGALLAISRNDNNAVNEVPRA